MEKLFQNQVSFETENKDAEIAALSQARQLQIFEIKRHELISNILVIVVALTIILLFTVYRSSTRRKRINGLLLEHQEEIKKRSAELEQLNQVKDKFFSIISHDLRSPMNALAGTLDLLEQKHISQEEFTEVSQSLRTQFNHTRSLINNLLDCQKEQCRARFPAQDLPGRAPVRPPVPYHRVRVQIRRIGAHARGAAP